MPRQSAPVDSAKEKVLAILAEFLATMIFIYVGCGAVVSSKITEKVLILTFNTPIYLSCSLHYCITLHITLIILHYITLFYTTLIITLHYVTYTLRITHYTLHITYYITLHFITPGYLISSHLILSPLFCVLL